MTELLLIRHGRPADGYLDPPLAVAGRAQAEATAQFLAAEPPAVVVSSDLRRAVETAEIVAAPFGAPVVELAGLREWDAPPDSPEYQVLESLPADHPARLAHAQGRFADMVPAGLDVAAMRRRVAGAFAGIVADHGAADSVAVVCHGGTINAWVGSLVGIAPLFWCYPDYLSITRVEVLASGRVVVRSLNETGHLRGHLRTARD